MMEHLTRTGRAAGRELTYPLTCIGCSPHLYRSGRIDVTPEGLQLTSHSTRDIDELRAQRGSDAPAPTTPREKRIKAFICERNARRSDVWRRFVRGANRRSGAFH